MKEIFQRQPKDERVQIKKYILKVTPLYRFLKPPYFDDSDLMWQNMGDKMLII